MNDHGFDFNAPVKSFVDKLPVWAVAISMLIISSCAAIGTTVLITKDVWVAIYNNAAELDGTALKGNLADDHVRNQKILVDDGWHEQFLRPAIML